MISRRLLLVQGILLLAGCSSLNSSSDTTLKRLIIGIVSYGEETLSIERFNRFVNYLGMETKSLIELEPAYNEIKALEQINRQAWDLVFAPPGLAAIAMSKARYLPLFPLQGTTNLLLSVLVVLKESKIQQLSDLKEQKIALGQPGSATGYYLPLYNLYGYTLAEVRLAPTPQTILEWVAKGEVAVGALSKDEFDRYRAQFSPAEFRIIYVSNPIPTGAVLISPKIELNQKELIQKAMGDISSDLAEDAGYIPNAKVPDYSTLIAMIERVKSIETKITEKPVSLFEKN